jgi:hypothetical protein
VSSNNRRSSNGEDQQEKKTIGRFLSGLNVVVAERDEPPTEAKGSSTISFEDSERVSSVAQNPGKTWSRNF